MSKDTPPIDPTTPVPSDSALPLRWVRVSHKTPDHIATRYLYAGYGSNLALTQMGRRCPGVDIIGPGLLRNARLVFARYLGIIQDESSTVPVGVYKCTAADVAALDRYEGLGRAYERILVTVECNGVAVRCFTYLKKDNEPEAPSDRYYDTCLAGYNDWQFDSRRLRHARDYARKHEKPRRPLAPWGSGHYFVNGHGDFEPIAGGSAAAYNRQQIEAKRQARIAARSPRPVGGRLGGADYIDSRLSVSEFKRRVEETRVPAVDGSDKRDRSLIKFSKDGRAIVTGRNGELWVRNKRGDAWERYNEEA